MTYGEEKPAGWGPQSLASSALSNCPPSECGDCGDPLETLSLVSSLQAITAQQRKRAGNGGGGRGGQAGFLLPLQAEGGAGSRQEEAICRDSSFLSAWILGLYFPEHAKLLTHWLQVCLEYGFAWISLGATRSDWCRPPTTA